jgi:hypothetical protein
VISAGFFALGDWYFIHNAGSTPLKSPNDPANCLSMLPAPHSLLDEGWAGFLFFALQILPPGLH